MVKNIKRAAVPTQIEGHATPHLPEANKTDAAVVHQLNPL
jgi:hypothetical protein